MEDISPQWRMAIDLERCIGCHACSVACKVENQVELGHFRTKVYYHDQGEFPHTQRSFLPALCMQCADAPCIKACPTHSIEKGKDGIVRINVDTCDTWGSCVTACPYGALHIDPVQWVADKCDFCSHRLEQAMQPACVEACPTGVLVFGDLSDAASPVAQFYQKRGAELASLKPEQATQPQVLYRGLDRVAPRAIETKLPHGRNHDPHSYEIDTWAELGTPT
ncbi:4Fe-4S dicluster domain-containing protein [Pseudomonas luteola]|uniref:4Fe-4S dicluster domain-containing protein n=1 Tax=Pseudomonas luteola TaxID=47886 RepID=UPI001EF6BB8D|nr:4Fe-4S dicluster domain-containing protein [Pseudomonas luteola]MCG7371619.1 4Fe-4S dicluster domain-containing protein [Pseudomonas luteola]